MKNSQSQDQTVVRFLVEIIGKIKSERKQFVMTERVLILLTFRFRAIDVSSIVKRTLSHQRMDFSWWVLFTKILSLLFRLPSEKKKKKISTFHKDKP